MISISGILLFFAELSAFVQYMAGAALLFAALFAYFNLRVFAVPVAATLLVISVALVAYTAGGRTADQAQLVAALKRQVLGHETLVRLQSERILELKRQLDAAEAIQAEAVQREQETATQAQKAKETADEYRKALAEWKDVCVLDSRDIDWLRK